VTEPVIAQLEAVWADIAELGDGLSAAEWNRPTDCPGWSVKDNVAHMIGTENMLRGVQPPAIEVGSPSHVHNDFGKFNEQWVLAYRNRTGADVLADFRAVTNARLDALRALPPEEWEKEGFTPEGRGPYRQFMEIRVFDCWYHDQDMREALDRPGFLDGPVADLSLRKIVVKGLPYVVGKKAAAPAGATIVFDVMGEPSIVAAVGVPPEGRATLLDEVPGSPTVRVHLDRRTFARLAGGRWSGGRARADGTVKVEGDAVLGKRVVDRMAFTI
jgi:uncharacterized protein (TIGR03083 family)